MEDDRKLLLFGFGAGALFIIYVMACIAEQREKRQIIYAIDELESRLRALDRKVNAAAKAQKEA